MALLTLLSSVLKQNETHTVPKTQKHHHTCVRPSAELFRRSPRGFSGCHGSRHASRIAALMGSCTYLRKLSNLSTHRAHRSLGNENDPVSVRLT